nr:ribosomal protein L7A/L8 [Tanacetum cinerariifolium]
MGHNGINTNAEAEPSFDNTYPNPYEPMRNSTIRSRFFPSRLEIVRLQFFLLEQIPIAIFVYKMVTFMVDLYHDGVFASNPLRYLAGEHRVIKDINFEVLFASNPLRYLAGEHRVIKDINFEGVPMNTDMYIEHQGYDVLEMINDDRHCEDNSDSDFEDVKKGDNLDDVKDIVDFQTESEENVDIPKLSINDPCVIHMN